jgi:hypothetical protein
MFLFDDLIHLRKKNVVFLNRKKIIFQKNHGFQVVSYLEYFFFYLILNWLTAFIKLNGVKVTPV